MLSEIEVKTVPPVTAMVIRRSVEIDEIGNALAEILHEVWGFVTARSGESAGPPFTRYLAWNADSVVDIEAGIPVALPLPAEGSVELLELPECRAVSVVHSGPYEKLGDAHMALGVWIKQNHYETAGPAWESYITDPGSEPDPAKWQTEVFWPVR